MLQITTLNLTFFAIFWIISAALLYYRDHTLYTGPIMGTDEKREIVLAFLILLHTDKSDTLD